MYYVSLPKSDGSKQVQTIASFFVEQQAINYAMKCFGTDENGNINLISNDGEDETIEWREIVINRKKTSYEVAINRESSYEISMAFYQEFANGYNPDTDPEFTGRKRICFSAFYSTKDSQWNLVGYGKYASTYDKLIDFCCEEIKVLACKNNKVGN